MIRKLITMSKEQERRLAILAGGDTNGNASGYIQKVIDKLFEARERILTNDIKSA